MNFEKIKEHDAFDQLNTYILEKIAHQIENKLGKSFEDLVAKYNQDQVSPIIKEIGVYSDTSINQATPKQEETNNIEQNKVRTMLDAVSYKVYAEKNVIMFLSLYPEGLTHEDIALLC